MCCPEAGSCGCKSIAMDMFWNRRNTKFLQGDDEPAQDTAPASVSAGLRGLVWGCASWREGSTVMLRL